MSLGNYMHSPVGFGAYGDTKSALTSLVTGGLKTVMGQVSGPVEISTPAELAGAKLTSGFKIIKEGDKYKIVLDAKIPGLNQFTGKVITGKDPIKEDLAGVLTLEYVPPPTNFTPIIIGVAVIAAAAIAFMMTRGGGATPAAARKRRKKRRRRRRR